MTTATTIRKKMVARTKAIVQPIRERIAMQKALLPSRAAEEHPPQRYVIIRLAAGRTAGFARKLSKPK